jgi:hypothetical protein
VRAFVTAQGWTLVAKYLDIAFGKVEGTAR